MNRISSLLAVIPAIILSLALGQQAYAGDINVRGKVIQQDKNEPLEGVVIFDAETDQLLGTTNAFGEYSVTIDENGTLLFTVLASKDLEEPSTVASRSTWLSFPTPRASASS